LRQSDLDRLLEDLAAALAARPGGAVAVVGRTAASARIVASVASLGPLCRLAGLYAPDCGPRSGDPDGVYQPLSRLREDAPDVVIVSEDAGKEDLLVALAPYVRPDTRVLVGGYGHLGRVDIPASFSR